MSRSRRKSHPPLQQAASAFSPRAFAADYFALHSVCADRRCGRAQRCEGGANPRCFTELWPLFDNAEKVKLRVAILALADGASVADAMAKGEATAALIQDQDKDAYSVRHRAPQTHGESLIDSRSIFPSSPGRAQRESR